MPLKTQQDDQPVLNLTPMIDVVFLLIIFFMVATKFVDMEHEIPLDLPEVAAASPSTPAPKQRVVTVRGDGTLALDGETVSLETLRGRLASAVAAYPGTSVVIRGAAESRFQEIASALSACKDARVAELGITVRLADGGGASRR